VLLVEDSLADAELALVELRRSGYDVVGERVADATSLERALSRGSWDLVLCDHGLPGFSSADALAMVRARDTEMPFVILSGSIGEEAAIAALKGGAMDVVLKTNLGRLGVIAGRELTEAATRRDHHAAEQALKESEARKTAMFDGALDAILAIDEEARIVDLNAAAETMFGLDTAQASGRPITDMVPLAKLLGSEPGTAQAITSVTDEPSVRSPGTRAEVRAKRVDESSFPAEVSVVEGWLSGAPFWTVFVRDLTERHRVEEAARAAERSYRRLFEGSPLAMLGHDAHSRRILEVNDAAVALYGYSRDEFAELTVEDIVVDAGGSGASVRSGESRSDDDLEDAARHLARDGHEIEVVVTTNAVRFGDRDAVFLVVDDVGERESLARKLRQSQRLESLGELAGGVAHDFNNLLGVILSYTGFVKNALTAPLDEDAARADVRRDLEQVEHAVQRAVRMTRQLLTFSRRDISRTQIVNVNDIVEDLHEMLDRTLGERVRLDTQRCPRALPVAIDPGQLEQVIVNLVVNARDAMPDGGQITVDTGQVELDDQYAATRPGTRIGRHVRLRVSDTGIGMDARTVDRAFEPFYTTKPKGKGTGLGLATIYGIVTRAGGHVRIHSSPGMGTTVSVLLPASEVDTDTGSGLESPGVALGGQETILLVEDQDALRDGTARILESAGYTVLAAANGDAALEAAQTHPDDIALLLTDVIMPGILGPEIAASLSRKYPRMRVVYVSGYAQPVLGADGMLSPDVTLLEKPFTESALLGKVRDVLDRRS
jgi:PAS domain S-box-containing protein